MQVIVQCLVHIPTIEYNECRDFQLSLEFCVDSRCSSNEEK